MTESELHSEEMKAAGAWRERGRNPRPPLRGLSCACFQASTEMSKCTGLDISRDDIIIIKSYFNENHDLKSSKARRLH